MKKTRGRWIKRFSIGAFVVAAAVLLVLMWNTMQLQSRQMVVTPVQLVPLDDQRISRVLSTFLSVPSYSHHDRSKMDPDAFLQLHQILQESFPSAHRVLERETVNDLSLLYRWPGRDESADPILLMSHLDVVPIEPDSREDWTHSPETSVISDGYIWGRGALDVKCGVIGIMAAIENLAENGFTPDRTVYLAFGHDEEIGGQEGNGAISKRFADEGIRFSYVLDEGGAILEQIIPGVDRPVAFIAIAEKRSADLSITARGAGGHGSMPGRSAIVNLAHAISRIDQQPMPTQMPVATSQLFDFLGPEMPLLQRTVIGNQYLLGSLLRRQLARSPSTSAVVRSTINVTGLSTGTAANQSASVATATINARLLPGDSIDDVRQHIMTITDDIRMGDGTRAIQCKSGLVSHGASIAPVDCDEFRMLQRTIHEVFPEVIVAPGLTAVSTDSAWYYSVTDKVYRFIPMRINATDLHRIHGVNERIGVENFAEIVRFYIQLLRNTAS